MPINNAGQASLTNSHVAPLIVSTVGHRDPDSESIKRNRNLLAKDLVLLMESIPETPIFMLNGLAEGMDLEAAEVFREIMSTRNALQANKLLHHRLIAVLPKKHDQYRQDFSNATELKRFDSLIAYTCQNVLDPNNCNDLCQVTNKDQGYSSPSDCYARQALYLVKNSYLLFAFNNGSLNGKVGGTSHSVLVNKKMVHSWYLSFDEVICNHEPSGTVEYFTNRLSNPVANDSKNGNKSYWFDSTRCKDLSDLLAIPIKLNQLNSSYIHESKERKGLSLPEFVDLEASLFKEKFQRSIYMLLIIGLVISLTLARPAWQILGLTSIVAAVFLFPSLQTKSRTDFIAYRCLAEVFKVIDQWIIFNVNHNPADFFKTQLHTNLAWTRTVMRSWYLQKSLDKQLNSHEREPILSNYKQDIIEQTRWLKGRIIYQKHADKNILRTAVGIMILGCLSSLLLFNASDGTIYKEIVDWITELMMALLVICVAYRELMGFKEINARYTRSRIQLKRSLKSLKIALNTSKSFDDSWPRIICAVEAIGCEKMDELNDWVSDQLKRSYRP